MRLSIETFSIVLRQVMDRLPKGFEWTGGHEATDGEIMLYVRGPNRGIRLVYDLKYRYLADEVPDSIAAGLLADLDRQLAEG